MNCPPTSGRVQRTWDARSATRPLPALVALAVVALACLGVSACCGMEENTAATQACTGMASNTACKACCGARGSRKTSYLSNKCTCYK